MEGVLFQGANLIFYFIAVQIEFDLNLETKPLHLTRKTMKTRFRRQFVRGHFQETDPLDWFTVFTALMLPTLPSMSLASTINPALAREDYVPVATPRNSDAQEERAGELELLTDFSSVGIARMDLQGRIRWVNEAWWNILGLDRSLSPDNWEQIIHPDSRGTIASRWPHSLLTLTPIAIEFKCTNGKSVLCHATPNNADFSQVTGELIPVILLVQSRD
jgi:PAS domain-containing protein